MAGAPRPGQNANGQAKQPSANPDGKAAAPTTTGAQSTRPAMAQKLPQQLQMRINYQNLSPVDQAQVAQQQLGVDPYAMLEMGQQAVGQATQLAQAGNPQQGPAPNSLSGPGVPDGMGLENFPHDMNALLSTMHAGYSPGASNMEHAQAQNAHAIARAQEVLAQQNAQNQVQHSQSVQALGGLFQQLQMNGQTPPAALVAQHVMGQPGATGAPPQFGGPPQLGSPMMSSAR